MNFLILTNAINEEFAQKKLAKKEAQKYAAINYLKHLFETEYFNSEALKALARKHWKHILSKSWVRWSPEDLLFLYSFPIELVLFLDDDLQDQIYEKIVKYKNTKHSLVQLKRLLLNSFSSDILKQLEKQIQERKEIKKREEEIEQERNRLLAELNCAEVELMLQEVELKKIEEQEARDAASKWLSEQKQKLEKFAEREGKLKNVSEQKIILKKAEELEALLKRLSGRDLRLTELDDIIRKFNTASWEKRLKSGELTNRKAALKKIAQEEEERLKELSDIDVKLKLFETRISLKRKELLDIEAKSIFTRFFSAIVNGASERDIKLREIEDLEFDKRLLSLKKSAILKHRATESAKKDFENEKKLKEKLEQQVATLTREIIEKQKLCEELRVQQDLKSKEISIIEAIPKKLNEQKNVRLKELAETETKLNKQEETQRKEAEKILLLQRGINAGLGNVRLNCYLNAAIQCLSNLPGFRRNILQNEEFYINDPIISNLIKVIKDLRTFGQDITNLDFINPAVDLMLSQDGNDRKAFQDAHEFISLLFDRLDRINPAATQSFNMQIINQFKCLSCNHEHLSVPELETLKLDLTDQPNTLEQLLNNSFKEEQPIGYVCDNCRSIQQTTKVKRISRYPNELMITFNRLDFDANTGIEKPKKNTSIRLPENLDLKPYATPELQQQEVNSLYELSGIICHEGAHYFSYVKDFQDEKWYLYNDTSIESVSERDIQNIITKSSLPYVLFYKSKVQQPFEIVDGDNHQHVQNKYQALDNVGWFRRFTNLFFRSQNLREDESYSVEQIGLTMPLDSSKDLSAVVQPMQVDPADSGFDSSDDEADFVAFAEATTFRGEGKS